MTSAITFASGLYWRKSRFNGFRCVPAIFSVDAGRLRLTSAKELAFDVPCAEARADFSMFWTLTIIIGDRKFDIVDSSPIFTNFNRAMVAELEQRKARTALPSHLSGATKTREFGYLNTTVLPWDRVLTAAGVKGAEDWSKR